MANAVVHQPTQHAFTASLTASETPASVAGCHVAPTRQPFAMPTAAFPALAMCTRWPTCPAVAHYSVCPAAPITRMRVPGMPHHKPLDTG